MPLRVGELDYLRRYSTLFNDVQCVRRTYYARPVGAPLLIGFWDEAGNHLDPSYDPLGTRLDVAKPLISIPIIEPGALPFLGIKVVVVDQHIDEYPDGCFVDATLEILLPPNADVEAFATRSLSKRTRCVNTHYRLARPLWPSQQKWAIWTGEHLDRSVTPLDCTLALRKTTLERPRMLLVVVGLGQHDPGSVVFQLLF